MEGYLRCGGSEMEPHSVWGGGVHCDGRAELNIGVSHKDNSL